MVPDFHGELQIVVSRNFVHLLLEIPKSELDVLFGHLFVVYFDAIIMVGPIEECAGKMAATFLKQVSFHRFCKES